MSSAAAMPMGLRRLPSPGGERRAQLLAAVRVWVVAGITTASLSAVPALAQEGHPHDDTAATHHGGLHFSHPLIVESISPDTKVRLDYFFRDVATGGGELEAKESTIRFEGEYALHRALSIEVNVPYTILDEDGDGSVSDFGSAEIALKVANFAFEERGILLGYGLEFGLPTGSDAAGIGSGHLFEVEPFLSAGYKKGKVEAIASTGFGIPTNQRDEEEIETELVYRASFLYHLTPRFQGLLELDGESGLSGEGEGGSVVNLSPGLKFQLIRGSALVLGLGAGVPLTRPRAFDTRAVGSVFYHF